jgi:hypothetical protein
MKPYMDQMATHGRYGDSMLVHMNPAEVQGIAALSPTGRLTTNPVTGQPEAFLPFLAPILGSMAGTSLAGSAITGTLASAGLGSTAAGILGGALSSGLGAGLATGLVTGDWDKAKMDFLGGALTGGMGATPGLSESTKLAQAGTPAGAGIDAAKQAVQETSAALAQQAGETSAQYAARLGSEAGAESLATLSQQQLAVPEAINLQRIQDAQKGVFGGFADAPMESLRGMTDMGFVVPKAISEGAKTAIDRERMEKAMYADVEAEREERLAEAQGNIQRGYVAAQPDAVRGPSEYRKHLSTYTEPYQYASQGGIVSLEEGGEVPDPLTELWNQSVSAGDLTPYFDRLKQLQQSGVDWANINLDTNQEDLPTPEDTAPEVPTSGYRVDPTTGATVYFDDTRPSLAREQGAGVPYNIGAISNPFGGGYMGGFGINNPGYKGVDPITIQANLRGRYAVDRPMGYMPGFEGEFRHFQSDLENIQVPSRQYAPQAAGPITGTPYFGTMVDPAAYLDEIGRYYSDIGAYRPRIGAAEIALDEEEVVEEDVADEEVFDEDVVDEEVIDEEVIDEEVVDEEKEAPPPVGGIVVGNYQGGARQQPDTRTLEELAADMVRWDEDKGQWWAEAQGFGGIAQGFKPKSDSEYYLTTSPTQTIEAGVTPKEAARREAVQFLVNFHTDEMKKKYAPDSRFWEGRTNLHTGGEGPQEAAQGGIVRMANGGQIPLGMDSPSGIAQADQAFVDGRGIAAVPTDFSQRGASMEPREKSLAEVPQQDVMVLAEALLRNDIPPQLKDSIIMDFQSKHGPRALEEARMVILSQGDPAVQTSGLVRGRGDGKSDSIMGSIGDQEGAIAVSDGEYIVGADVVSAAGNGSTEAGAEFFEELSDNLRRGTTGTTDQTRKINPREMI